MTRRIIHCLALVAALTALTAAVIRAGCENDLMFGVGLDDPQQAFVAEPLNFSTPFTMNRVLNFYVIDRGVNFFRNEMGAYELGSVRVQQVSCTPGLTGGAFFGGSNPGYLDLNASNPHKHLNWGVSAPGTYFFEFRLTNAIDINGAPLKDSPVFLMVFVADTGYAAADVKTACRMPDGSKVAISDLIASSDTQFAGLQYAQSSDRRGGIRLQTSAPVPIGTRFSVTGVLGTVGGERTLTVHEVTASAPETAPQPLMTRTSCLGGFGEVINMPSSVGASGLRTTGLLVKVCGRISYNAYADAFIDDGAGVTNEPGVTGVRISMDDLLSPFDLPAEVTGISGVDENLMPVIRPRASTDVRVLY